MTLHFQIQFLRQKCTENTKSTIKSALKSDRKKKKVSMKKSIKDQKRKCKELRRDITEIQSQEDSIEKGNIRKILNKKKIKNK